MSLFSESGGTMWVAKRHPAVVNDRPGDGQSRGWTEPQRDPPLQSRIGFVGDEAHIVPSKDRTGLAAAPRHRPTVLQQGRAFDRIPPSALRASTPL